MSLKERLRADLLEARKAKNQAARNVLTVILGDIQTAESTHAALSDDQIEAKLRKLAENNQEVINANPASPNAETLREEIKVVSSYLPKSMSADEIRQFVAAQPGLVESIRAAKEGQAIGLVMKALKQADFKALGSDVKEAVVGLRG
jgi:uncharacterized protein